MVGVYVPQDPGGSDDLAKHGEVAFDFGLFWFKGQSMGTGQCPVKRYHRHLRDLINMGKASPSFIVSHELPLTEAPRATSTSTPATTGGPRSFWPRPPDVEPARSSKEDNGMTDDRLMRALGWASLGLGVPQVMAPGEFSKAIGTGDGPRQRMTTAVVGVRELAAASGLLWQGSPAWLWARVGGDLMDLGLLGRALKNHDGRGSGGRWPRWPG